MGFNVMALDAGSHFSDDPYIYLKGPPLARAALVSMSSGSLKGIMVGQFLYAQNAAPNGPVAWVLSEAVERVRGACFGTPAPPSFACIRLALSEGRGDAAG